MLATDNGQAAIYSTEDPQHTSEQTSWTGGRDAGRTEYDPVGADAGTYNFYQDQPQPDRDLPEHSGVMSEPADGCLADGMADDCRAMALLAVSGAQVYFTYQRQASLAGMAYDSVTSSFRPSSAAWRSRWVDSFDASRAYTFTYNGQTYTDTGSVVSTDEGYIDTGLDGEPLVTQTTPQKSMPQLVPPSKPVPELIRDLLKKGDCASYVQRLLDKATEMFAGKYPHVNTISEAIDKISQAGGYQLDSHGIHTVSGDLFYKGGGAQPGTVHLIPFRSFGTPSASAVAHAQYYYAISGLHESFHLARQGGYNDELMAQAAYSLAGKKLPSPDPRLDDFGKVAFYSDLWDAELTAHCKE